MNTFTRIILATLVAMLSVVYIGAAHRAAKPLPGSIHATVNDARTGDKLKRATVIIVESRQGAMTNDSGQAHIVNVSPGRYTLIAKYPGMNADTLRNIIVEQSKTTDLVFSLSQKNVLTTVTGEHIVTMSKTEISTKFSPPPVSPSSSGRKEIIQITPGSVQTNATDGLSFHGTRGADNNISYNGNRISQLAISEINVATGHADASLGDFSGGYFERSPYNLVNTAEYHKINENDYKIVQHDPLSTFSIDVDGASYSNIRHFITAGAPIPADAVRIEEMVNYFKYDYPQPTDGSPFSIATELTECPWNKDHQLALIGLQGKEISKEDAPPANLTFLIDVSGSMEPEERLPLIQRAFRLLVSQLRPQDKVAIVVYAGAPGLVLPPTGGDHKDQILDAIDRLQAGGSTAGGAGIELAYKTALEQFDPKKNNRVILATDGDFNVGISNTDELVKYIEQKRTTGIYLTTIGVGTDNYKDDKMKQLADKGNGNYYYIDNILEAKKVFVTQMGGTLNAIAKDVKIQIEFNPAKVRGYRLLGYESRLLEKEDFNNDKKDAGELGSGHTVTALYEIIPSDAKDSTFNTVDPLRYQILSQPLAAQHSDEVMAVKFRYKLPKEDTSKLIVHPVVQTATHFTEASNNLRFAASVAEFGMLLRDSKFKGAATVGADLALARSAKGEDTEGYRAEFIKLIETYQLADKASK